MLHSREASTSVNVVLSGVADLDLKGKLLNGRWKGQVVRKVTTAMRQQRSVEEEEIILVLPKRVFLYGGGALLLWFKVSRARFQGFVKMSN